MKRLFFSLILIGIIMSTPNDEAWAQFQNEVISFRSKALGEIINDDLDLIYDPIELRFVNGIRLYTNLTNLTSTQENIFDNYADNEMLIGLSFKNPIVKNFWNSLLFRLENSKTSNVFTLDPDLSGPSSGSDHYGSYTSEYTSYLDDLPYDGIYDTKVSISQTKSDFTTDDSYAFILNNTLALSRFTVGLKFSSGRSVTDFMTASYLLGSGRSVLSSTYPDEPTFSKQYSTYLVEENFRNYSWNEQGDFLTRFKDSNFKFDVAAMMPLSLPRIGNVELRTDLGYWSENLQFKINDSYNGTIARFHRVIADYDSSYHETDALTALTDRDGGTFRLGASVKKIFNPQAERKNDGYWQIGFELNFSAFDYANDAESAFSNRDYFFDGMDTLRNDSEKSEISKAFINDNGDENVFFSGIGGKLNIPLDEKVYFGIGAFYRFSTIKRETRYEFSALDQTNFTQFDENDDDDYVEQTASQETADRTWRTDLTNIIVPVGIEYKFTKNNKWALRFGAIFEYQELITNDAMQITNSVPPVTITEWGDGTIDVGSPPPENNYQSTSNQIKETTSITTFTYGLGYYPIKNLQIDLLGFFGNTNHSILDSQFYRNLRLSFSLNF